MDQNSPEYSVIMAPNTNQTMIPQHTQSNYSPSPTSSITSTSMMMNSSSSPLKDLFVGNLSFFCQEKHLKELFSKYGEVANIRIKRNDKGGRSLMYGFISMATTTAAQSAAINLHQQLFMGRNIR